MTPDGANDIPGLWIENSECAKFWLRVMNELKNRSVEDVLIAVAAELKKVCRAKDAEAGKEALEAFDACPWGRKYPSIAQAGRRNREQVIASFALPEAARRIIYTTCATESSNAKLRRAVRARDILQPTRPP